MTNRRTTGIIAAAGLILSLTGCGAKGQEPFKDAPRDSSNTAPADTWTMPDGFSNGSTKCDHGNRIYVVFKGDAAYGAIAVVPQDPTCG
jgi:predicted small lipoprotein YifL